MPIKRQPAAQCKAAQMSANTGFTSGVERA